MLNVSNVTDFVNQYLQSDDWHSWGKHGGRENRCWMQDAQWHTREGGEWINPPDWWRVWMETRGKNRRWRGVVLGERQKDTKREGEGGAWHCSRIEVVLRNMSERVWMWVLGTAAARKRVHAVWAALACSFTDTQQGVVGNALLILKVWLHKKVPRLPRHEYSNLAEELLRKHVYLPLPGTTKLLLSV